VGHPLEGWTPEGRALSSRVTRKCFRCHTTRLAARSPFDFDESTMIPGVSCERCHGPGRAHIEAAKAGADADALRLPFGLDRPGANSGNDADAVLRLCGQCHRHPSQAPRHRIRPDDPGLARFQPIGLMQSACYRNSAGRFSCLSCHDPHARVSPSASHYEAVCLGCHTDPGATRTPQSARNPLAHLEPSAESITEKTLSGLGRACPVSPTGGCLPCHMPRRDSGQRVLFTDHWIRVRREPASDTQAQPTGTTTEQDFDDL
jgi:predicted CXXCH cytochrome family protein